MPPPKKEISILDALNPIKAIEDFLQLPKDYKITIVGMYKKDAENVFLVVARSSNSGTPDSSYLIATNIGDHAISDIKGVNSSVNVKNLNTPVKVIKAVGQAAINQAFDLEEFGADIRREQFKQLVSNSNNGGSLGIYKLGPSIFNIGASPRISAQNTPLKNRENSETRFYMLAKDNTTGRYVDRGEYEKRAQGDTRKRKTSVYKDLSSAFIGLGSLYEDKGSRESQYSQVASSFLRIAPDEMGLNLDGTAVFTKLDNGGNVVSTKRPQLLGKGSSLVEQVNSTPIGGYRSKLDAFLSNPANINKALQLDGLVDASGNPVSIDLFNNSLTSQATQRHVRFWIENEYYNSIFYADDLVNNDQMLEFLQKVCPTDADFNAMPKSLRRALNSFAGIPEGVNGSYENISTLIQNNQFKFSKKGLSGPPGRINAANKLNSEFIKNGRLGSVGHLQSTDFGIPVVGKANPKKGIWGLQGFKTDLEDRQKTLYQEAIYNFRENKEDIIDSVSKVYKERLKASNVSITNIDVYVDDLRARIRASFDATELADALNTTGAFEDIFEAVANDKLLNQLIINSRFPIGKFKIDSLNPISIAKNILNDEYNNSGIIPHLGIGFAVRHEIVDEIPAFSPQSLYLKAANSKLGSKLPLRNKIWVELGDVNAQSSTRVKTKLFGKIYNRNFWKRTAVDVTEGQGLFWANGAKPMQSYFSSLEEIESFTYAEYLLSRGNAYQDFISWANAFENGIGNTLVDHESKLEALLKLGLLDETAPGSGIFVINQTNAASFQNTGQQFELIGVKMLEKLEDMGIITPALRAKFLEGMITSGKYMEFSHYIIGPLNHFNKFANSVKDFFFQEVIQGEIGKKIGLQKLFQTFGIKRMPAENWKILLANYSKDKGVFYFLSTLGTKFTALGDQLLLKGVLKKILGLGLQLIGKALGYASSIFTAGVSFILTSFSSAVTKFLWNLVKLKPKEAVTEAGTEIKKTIYTFARLIGWALGIILVGCGLIFGVPILIIVAIVAGLAPKDSGMGGASYGSSATIPTESSLIRVTKTATPPNLSTKTITYTIVIENITSGTDATSVKIAAFNDELTYTPSCNPDGYADTYMYGTSGFIGQVISPSTFPNPTDYIGVEIAPNEEIEISFTLSQISTSASTYVNFVEVSAEGETGKVATSTVSTNIGEGGCAMCPQGWPFALSQSYSVTQGPGGSYTHGNVEAADFGGAIGNPPVYATHSGNARVGFDASGYGNFVDVISPKGFRTRYAHMDSVSITGGWVSKGRQLGTIGNTGGTSTGKHLHYEIIPKDRVCLAGEGLRLKRVSGDFYIPVTINRDCGGDDQPLCNQTVP